MTAAAATGGPTPPANDIPPEDLLDEEEDSEDDSIVHEEVDPGDPVDVARHTMLGDLMKVVINLAKALPKPWQQLSEREQDNWLSSVDRQCAAAIEQVVNLLAEDGHVSIGGTLVQIVFKDGCKAQIEIDRGSPVLHDLIDSCNQPIRLVLANVQDYTSNASTKPRAEKQQTQLPLDEPGEAELPETRSQSEAACNAQAGEEESDELYAKAVASVRATQNPTVSALQRELRIGYNRAARLLERMETDGIVSPMSTQGDRTVIAESAEA